jgi:hypothetical protein
VDPAPWLVATLVGGLVGTAALATFLATRGDGRGDWSGVVLGVLIAPSFGGLVGITVAATLWISRDLSPSDAYPMSELAGGVAAWAFLNLLLGLFVVPLIVVPIAAVGALLGGAVGRGTRRWARPPGP